MNDPRLLPARKDVAAAHLKGKVEAARYVEGVAHQAGVGVSALREAPTHSSRLETQVLLGETFTAYDSANGWAWGQCARDGYVGYVEADRLRAPPKPVTDRVRVLRTLVFPEPDIKSAPPVFLPINAKVAVARAVDRFAELTAGGYVIAAHLTPIDSKVEDWVTSAELFLNTPYLWGGKDGFGVDCSGLVQASLETGGIASPRDADQQEAALGASVAHDLGSLKRGDLVFWKGHVGIVRGPDALLHASGHHMLVVSESLSAAAARIAATDGEITSVKRLQ